MALFGVSGPQIGPHLGHIWTPFGSYLDPPGPPHLAHQPWRPWSPLGYSVARLDLEVLLAGLLEVLGPTQMGLFRVPTLDLDLRTSRSGVWIWTSQRV